MPKHFRNTTIGTKLTKEAAAKFAIIAKRRGVTVSELVRDLVMQSVNGTVVSKNDPAYQSLVEEVSVLRKTADALRNSLAVLHMR